MYVILHILYSGTNVAHDLGSAEDR